MSDERIDPETLAAFLDGRLSGRERDSAVTKIARSEDEYALLIDSRDVLRDISGRAAGAAPSLIAPRTPWRRWRYWGGFAAAALAASIVVVTYTGHRPSTLLDLATITESGERAVVNLGVANASSADTRGPASGGESPGLRALRLGATLTQADVALRLGDQNAAHTIVESLARDAGQFEFGAPLRLTLERSVSDGALGITDWTRTRRDLRALTGSDSLWFDLGSWTETAQAAAHSGDTKFFSSGGPAMRALDEMHTLWNPEIETRDSRLAAVISRLDAMRAALPTSAEQLLWVASSLDSLATIIR